jgi:release factor glutamine methyltransferase
MGVNIQTIKDIRFYLAKELEEIYKEPEAGALINIIIKNITGLPRFHQLSVTDKNISAVQVKRIIEICKELKTGKPIQYILGETIFYGCKITINSSTLIPRPETEELVDLIIRENKGFTGNITDIGTGSGCIAVALAANLPGSLVTGIDISGEAIRIAQENAVLNNVNVLFKKNDIFDFDYAIKEKADIIVSNPPYVRISEKQFMNKNVLDFEPHIALFVTDSEPLVYYRAILKIAEKILVPGGKVYFEINEAMGKPMIRLLGESGYSNTEIVADINNKDRIAKGLKNG